VRARLLRASAAVGRGDGGNFVGSGNLNAKAAAAEAAKAAIIAAEPLDTASAYFALVIFFASSSKSLAFQMLLRCASWLKRNMIPVDNTSSISLRSSAPNNSVPGMRFTFL
jgi:hypothetical protein